MTSTYSINSLSSSSSSIYFASVTTMPSLFPESTCRPYTHQRQYTCSLCTHQREIPTASAHIAHARGAEVHDADACMHIRGGIALAARAGRQTAPCPSGWLHVLGRTVRARLGVGLPTLPRATLTWLSHLSLRSRTDHNLDWQWRRVHHGSNARLVSLPITAFTLYVQTNPGCIWNGSAWIVKSWLGLRVKPDIIYRVMRFSRCERQI